MNPTDKMEMQVSEENDGSAIVSLPDDQIQQNSAGNDDNQDQIQQDNDFDDQDDDNQDDGRSDDDREAIRAARREERKLKKQLHRDKARESNNLIRTLRKQNQDLAERIARLEKTTSGAELARVDKAIDDAATRVEYAKMKMKDAVSIQDGNGVVKAQEMLYEAQRQLESLKAVKDQATRQISQPQQNIQVPDNMVQMRAADWMERNPWYDPQGRDSDSAITQTIDKKLSEEGYDPSTDEYWDELDSRIQKYLPHKQMRSYNDENGTRNQRPRTVVTSSGRESGRTLKANEVVLDPERVRAMKEAGMWDNPELRKKMIAKYINYDRNNKQ